MTRIVSALAGLAVIVTMVIGFGNSSAQAAEFQGWEYTVSVGSTDGLRLDDVSYNGTKIFDRVSLPVMNVFYENDVCGPYTDKLGGDVYEGPFGSDFTLDGVRWRSIGMTDYLGRYEITMYYYMSENGDFDAHMFSRGVQCNNYHEHLPFWRLDFDLAGTANDQIFRKNSDGTFTAETNEFSTSATAAADHGWEVRDSVTGDRVTIDFDDGSFTIPGTVIPETDYQNNMVYGRQYEASETIWRGGATRDLFGDNDQTMADVVLWYAGWMPHTAEEGPALWHSTGIHLEVNPDDSGEEATIGGRATDLVGAGTAGVLVDLFEQNAEGSRETYLETVATDSNGDYSFTVSPGCYTVVFIAPADASLQGGGQYLERSACLTANAGESGLDAVVIGGEGTGDVATDGEAVSSSGSG